ncbi:hypothetical protein D3C87_1794220 [compost metagenome]
MKAPPKAPAARAIVTAWLIPNIGNTMNAAIVRMIGGTIKALRRTVAGLPFLNARAAKITTIEITRPKVERSKGRTIPAKRVSSGVAPEFIN